MFCYQTWLSFVVVCRGRFHGNGSFVTIHQTIHFTGGGYQGITRSNLVEQYYPGEVGRRGVIASEIA